MSKVNLWQRVRRFKGAKVAILGDLMLDEHLWCEVSRISPEAPVPVARVKQITHEPGGAANVAHNVTDLGGDSYLFGTVGYDDSGEKLMEKLKLKKIRTDCLIRTQSRPTILKSRIIAHQQHVVRVDRERTDPIQPKTYQRVLETFRSLAPELHAVLISDYHKGFLTDQLTQAIIKLARHYHIPVLVDPKGIVWRKYRGATLLTPNRGEAEAAAKMKLADDVSLSNAAAKLIRQMALSYLLVTRSEQGMTLFPSRGRPWHVSAVAREVFDITGAGDTVIAALALGLATSCPIKEAVVIANAAASIVVTKVGTATANAQELGAVLQKLNRSQPKLHPW